MPRIANVLEPYCCGGTAAIIAASTIHPIDLAKTRIQVLGLTAKPGDAKPAAIPILKQIFKSEGVPGLYAGLSASVMRQAVYGTARLGLHRSFSNKLEEMRGGKIPLWQKIGSSFVSGAIASTIGNPCDLAMVRMQADSLKPIAERRGYKNVFDAITRVVKEEGLFTLWRGCSPTVYRAIAMNVGMLATFDQAKDMLTPLMGDRLITTLTSSALAGFGCAFMSLPFDMMRTRLMNMKPLPDGSMPFKNTLDVAVKTVSREGVPALWRGFVPFYLRCAPHAMIILCIMESVRNVYRTVTASH
eukprot:TRINITY_DN1348_c0_g1_i1.p1 TRINITY_DN1348_c0_g1~~TRINITY_DN1348_c0_g1_i1.p1  ORF type:complete len:301 (-),score=79.32 TRINITY_DN1348_c0_g1_i1:141-1043(-)